MRVKLGYWITLHNSYVWLNNSYLINNFLTLYKNKYILL